MPFGGIFFGGVPSPIIGGIIRFSLLFFATFVTLSYTLGPAAHPHARRPQGAMPALARPRACMFAPGVPARCTAYMHNVVVILAETPVLRPQSNIRHRCCRFTGTRHIPLVHDHFGRNVA